LFLIAYFLADSPLRTRSQDNFEKKKKIQVDQKYQKLPENPYRYAADLARIKPSSNKL
jgi:hypothetical protein